jgi:hypothetical protein
VTHRLAVAALIAVAMLGLVSCSNSTPGTAAPSAGSTQSPTAGTSSVPNTAGPSLSSIQPCDLLSAIDLSQNQLAKSDSGTGSGARSCSWQNATADNGFGYAIGVDVRDSQGLKDINTAGYIISDDPIGSHPGKQAQDSNGAGCIVAIGVGAFSRVDVVATGSNGAAESCQLANRFAKLVEPNLPAGGS